MIESAISEENLHQMVELASTAPPGPFVEVGVFKGGSAIRLYDVCLRQTRELHLFDSFRGMPVRTEGLDPFQIGSFMVDRDTPNRLLTLMPLATIHTGIYPATHPTGLADVAFVHVDCDQYLSYKAVIEHMWPIMVEGGIMLFDDYPYLPGAKKAVEEVFDVEDLLPCGEHFYALKGYKAIKAEATAE